MREIGAKASLFTVMMQIAGVAMVILIPGEPVTPSLIGGTLMIVPGLFLSLRKESMPTTKITS